MHTFKFLAALFFFLCSCDKLKPNNERNNSGTSVTIHLNDRRQIIRNFGASDAWSCQFIGLWPDEKRNTVADWLFSTENDSNGKPKGIGLSLWRFNIGAGSAAQNNIGDEWRRAEGFLNDDMTYDWSRQPGQRWFMHAAKQRGVDQFLGFTNSPPVQLTKNGKAFSSDGERANLLPGNYLSFADFLVSVAKHFRDENIPLDFISPFNEPQWDWTGSNQEGCPYTNREMAAITKAMDFLISEENLDLKIQVAEAGKLNYLYENADKPTRGEQIYGFFNTRSPLFVGDLPNVDKVISGHSYFTSAPAQTLRSVRKRVSEAMKTASVPLEFWQSEYCILGDHEEVKAEGKDTGITPALYVARIMHHDLTVAEASAWHWWLAVSVYDYKDGLIYAEKNKADGHVEDTKLLWAVGNFSRFIRPGAQRITVSSENMSINDANGIMISSYSGPDHKQVVTVIVNYGLNDTVLAINTTGGEVGSWQPYITGPGEDEKLKPLPKVDTEDNIVIPERSIVTLVGELQ